nr:immunoglobulin heavy chain junction region [Macaca mulatta]MOX04430.1 immunoglobulin heavy chain junction region [Macaca mulatta]
CAKDGHCSGIYCSGPDYGNYFDYW